MCALNTRCTTCRGLLGPEDAVGSVTDPALCCDCRKRAEAKAQLEREEESPHALHARQVKVGKLVDEIDRQCGYAGLDPHADGFKVVEMAQRWRDDQWAQIAVNAATKPPSDKSRAQVIERYRERGRAAQQRSA